RAGVLRLNDNGRPGPPQGGLVGGGRGLRVREKGPGNRPEGGQDGGGNDPLRRGHGVALSDGGCWGLGGGGRPITPGGRVGGAWGVGGGGWGRGRGRGGGAPRRVFWAGVGGGGGRPRGSTSRHGLPPQPQGPGSAAYLPTSAGLSGVTCKYRNKSRTSCGRN